jgi:hypothetical protein
MSLSFYIVTKTLLSEKKMKKIISIFALMLLVVSSSYAKEETASEGLKAIINCYKTGNFDTLVKERYAELFKAKNEAEIEKIIAYFSKRFSNKEKLDQVVAMFTEISKATPVVTPVTKKPPFGATKVAKFDFGKKRPYVLWLLPSGKWAFTM